MRTYGAKMKQKYLVVNCDANDIEDLRRRMGFDRELVVCSSMDEAARLMPTPEAGVLVSVSSNNNNNNINGVTNGHASAAVMSIGATEPSSAESMDGQPSLDTSKYVDELLAKVLEHSNGHGKTLAARVDLLEQKIIEHCLNRNGQHRKETAAELGISRVTLYNKMKKFGLLD